MVGLLVVGLPAVVDVEWRVWNKFEAGDYGQTRQMLRG